MNSRIISSHDRAAFAAYYCNDGLPSGVLEDAWREQLRDIESADSFGLLSVKHYHATCWLAALVQAGVISPATAVQLRDARDMAHQIAGDRLTSNPP